MTPLGTGIASFALAQNSLEKVMLWTRKEKEIAVATHSGFLYHTLNFANCELPSMVIVDRSMIGSDAPTTNHPGKIPSGVDLPSDVAAEKHPKQGASQ
ncbi:hypothetical protein KPL70_015742 [Citrus sinensis]|uniref:Uncharacterized protein n=1 Tax=Citrus clementina TaxID=85681 RepID=V4T6B6_CITCL|nr:hypothetical protein CICLE_v10003426mg [Citrus x clementina]KAH9690184.1 hypothetical protein KPL70_015742 [Citrus sinensis]